MKRKWIFLIATAIFLSSLTGVFAAEEDLLTTTQNEEEAASPVFQTVSFNEGVVSAYYLNLRQGPSTAYARSMVLKKGDAVQIIGQMGEWFVVIDKDSGNLGCAHSSYITVPEDAVETVDKKLELSEDEKILLSLINEARKEEGLAELQPDFNLFGIARLKAQDMVDNDYFSHESDRYGLPWDMMSKYEISFKSAGENIAGNKTVEGAFNAWIKDKAHARNILNEKFNYTGIGIVDSPVYGKILVQQFIGR
ncbi:MAG: CAP domain-containing protein [Eubacteriales bacterium]|nr:CAP domain-containing protein [Eubacteriales bacterium]